MKMFHNLNTWVLFPTWIIQCNLSIDHKKEISAADSKTKNDNNWKFLWHHMKVWTMYGVRGKRTEKTFHDLSIYIHRIKECKNIFKWMTYSGKRKTWREFPFNMFRLYHVIQRKKAQLQVKDSTCGMEMKCVGEYS